MLMVEWSSTMHGFVAANHHDHEADRSTHSYPRSHKKLLTEPLTKPWKLNHPKIPVDHSRNNSIRVLLWGMSAQPELEFLYVPCFDLSGCSLFLLSCATTIPNLIEYVISSCGYGCNTTIASVVSPSPVVMIVLGQVVKSVEATVVYVGCC